MTIQNLTFFSGQASSISTNRLTDWVNGNVFCVPIKTSYTFNAAHNLATVLLHAGGPATPMTGLSVSTIGTQTYAFDADDLRTQPIVDDSIGSFLIYYNRLSTPTPLGLFFGVHGLPGTATGGTLDLSFSTSISKVFRSTWSGSQYNIDHDTHLSIFQAPVSLDTFAVDSLVRKDYGLIKKQFSKSKTDMYSDLAALARSHPLTGDMTTVVSNASINQSIKNILLTDPGTRPFSSIKFGAGIKSMLFELGDGVTASRTERAISIALSNYEPRIVVLNVVVENIPDKWAVSVRVVYSIKMTNATGSFDLFLERA